MAWRFEEMFDSLDDEFGGIPSYRSGLEERFAGRLERLRGRFEHLRERLDDSFDREWNEYGGGYYGGNNRDYDEGYGGWLNERRGEAGPRALGIERGESFEPYEHYGRNYEVGKARDYGDGYGGGYESDLPRGYGGGRDAGYHQEDDREYGEKSSRRHGDLRAPNERRWNDSNAGNHRDSYGDTSHGPSSADILRNAFANHRGGSHRNGPRTEIGYYVTNDRGPRYAISDQELQLLQDPSDGFELRPLSLPIKPPQAGRQLMAPHPIERTAEYRDAWRRIKQLRSRSLTWHDYELVTKMFNDLDTAIFHGDLRYRVYLIWEDMQRSGNGTLNGYCRSPLWGTGERIGICMATRGVFGTLLHEMLHAYLKVWSRGGTDQEPSIEPERGPGHGQTFMTCARYLERRLGNVRIV